MTETQPLDKNILQKGWDLILSLPSKIGASVGGGIGALEKGILNPVEEAGGKAKDAAVDMLKAASNAVTKPVIWLVVLGAVALALWWAYRGMK